MFFFSTGFTHTFAITDFELNFVISLDRDELITLN